MGGPIWSAPIHDQEWVASIIEDVNRMKSSYPAYEHISAILNTISEVCVFLQGLFFRTMHIILYAIFMCSEPMF